VNENKLPSCKNKLSINMEKIINLCKNSASYSLTHLRDYEIMILNNGMGSPPKLKSKGIRALRM